MSNWRLSFSLLFFSAGFLLSSYILWGTGVNEGVQMDGIKKELNAMVWMCKQRFFFVVVVGNGGYTTWTLSDIVISA